MIGEVSQKLNTLTENAKHMRFLDRKQYERAEAACDNCIRNSV